LVCTGNHCPLMRRVLPESTADPPKQLIPQIVINYRRHNATGLQPTMMMLWSWAGVPLGVYNISRGFNIALQIQPQILTFLSLVTWIQCFYYEKVDSSGYACGTRLTATEMERRSLTHRCPPRSLFDGRHPGWPHHRRQTCKRGRCGMAVGCHGYRICGFACGRSAQTLH
jgi:hypothetical protein